MECGFKFRVILRFVILIKDWQPNGAVVSDPEYAYCYAEGIIKYT